MMNQIENNVNQVVKMFRIKGYSDEWILGFALSEFFWNVDDTTRDEFIRRVGELPSKNV